MAAATQGAQEKKMKVGDLVKKRWGRIDPHEIGTIGICLGSKQAPGLLLTGPLIQVGYPGRRPRSYKPEEFEVVSENR